jgi:pilus assembly protein CpaB
MTRRLLTLVVAVLLAGLGTIAVVGYVRSADDRALAGREAVTVLVAAQRIPAGTTADRIRAGRMAQPITVPASTVPDDALEQLDTGLSQLVVTADVQPRQLLLRGQFGKATTVTGGLPLPTGTMAVSVALATPQHVAGYVRPGASIAIFDTFTLAEGKGHVPAGDKLEPRHDFVQGTRVLLPRVQVVAVGAYGNGGVTSAPGAARTSSGESTSDGKTAEETLLVTVAVTQDQAERLVHAAQTGSLYLALLTDSSDVRPGEGVDNYTLFR